MSVEKTDNATKQTEAYFLRVPGESIERLKKLFPEAKAALEENQKLLFEDIDRRVTSTTLRATIFERTLLLAGGTFALSLSFVGNVQHSLDSRALKLHEADHLLLYLGWVSLILAILLSVFAGYLCRYQSTVCG
jgi:hypothetical protein